jgi:ATP-dependent DNA helicase RecG
MEDQLQTDIKFLTGVGPKRAELLSTELNICTFEDLLYHFPYKYIDRSRFYKISEINSQLPYIQIRGHISRVEILGTKYKKRMVADFVDDTGKIELVWFRGISWIRESLKKDREYVAFGKPTVHGRQLNLVHPELEESEKFDKQLSSGLQAMYSTTEKLKKNHITSRTLQKIISTLFNKHEPKLKETLSEEILQKLNVPILKDAIFNLHFPSDHKTLELSRYRMKFEELFFIQLNILKQKLGRETHFRGLPFANVGDMMNIFYRDHLPFQLTEAQKRVMREIRKDMGSGRQMNRLLQGDVGSGKTLVALMSILISLDNGYQGCIMAPTEILARQHYETLKKMIGEMPVNFALLTGSTKKKEREILHSSLEDGSLNILVGTHALLEDAVKFQNLGLCVIDEQHRFGVAQRARLWKKNIQPPHVLVMTATPIPRTLAMTLYGDLDVSVIDELPPGRKAIKTISYTDSKRLRLHGFMKKEIAEGRQIYVVYPLIKESEKMDYKDLEDGYFSIRQAFPSPQYAVSMVHGKMKADDKEFEMRRFIEKKTHILIATTVIEVGVDISNASVMVIESAERFGLSQLHQLRGRVGRGANQSWCILMRSDKLGDDARLRIDTMVSTNDGFEIAETDLKLRGPGDIEGTQQSGIPFDLKIANLGKDGQILQYARQIAIAVLEKDPRLDNPANKVLIMQLKKLSRGSFDWSVIS